MSILTMDPRRIDKILIVAVPIAIFLIMSIQPTTRLQVEMPAEFVDATASQPGHRGASEKETARAFWDCAVDLIQYKYAYGSPLPLAPPPEFQVDQDAFPTVKPDAATRLRYWQRLQKVWVLPTVWEKGYEWSFRWFTDAASGIAGRISRLLRDLFRM
jgi:hypothetical protein